MANAVTSKPAKGLHSATWSLTSGDGTGSWLDASQFTDKSLHVYCAGTVPAWVLEGSNDKTNAVTLNDALGVAIGYSAQPKLVQVLENAQFIRPRITGGADGTTALTAIVLSRSGEM